MKIEILLVEDNPGDVRLTREALRECSSRINLHVTADGEDAMAFLHREGDYATAPRPALVLLDLNLPRMSGREVLRELRSDPSLGCIPVVVLTTSDHEEDIVGTYQLHANAYVSKPTYLDQFDKVVKIIEQFWLQAAKLPPHCGGRKRQK